MSKMRLGRAKYKILRHTAGGYDENGVWGGEVWTPMEIRASIHRGIYWNSEKFTNAGTSTKQAISIRSDHALYMGSPAGTENGGEKKADIIEYLGTYWQVKEAGQYHNLRATAHWEAVAVRLDESELPRVSP